MAETHKSTPGPWRVLGNLRKTSNFDRSYRVNIAAIDFKNVAYAVSPHRDECSANARLIAAAPELYEALQALVHATPPEMNANKRFNAAWQTARAALAKAKGE